MLKPRMRGDSGQSLLESNEQEVATEAWQRRLAAVGWTMASLPGGDRAVVPRAKLTEYLLSEAHPVGRTKARYFRSAGFGEHNAGTLAEGLLAIARSEEVIEEVSSPHGTKFVVDGDVTAPIGALRLRTIWIIEPGVGYPRFVTAYPASSRGGTREGNAS